MILIDIMKGLGFSENEIKVYINLLVKGQGSVRTIADITKIGRGTVYNILKDFQKRGIVGFSEKGKLKYFTAKDPESLAHQFSEREREVQEAKQKFESILPELKSMYGGSGKKPNVSYYTGRSGIKAVLEDVLFTMSKSKSKMVYLYSSMELRSIIYEAFPEYTEKRIKLDIKTRAIKMGKGGFLRGLDEAKILAVDKENRTYIHIYGNKVSYITSKSSGYIMCVIIEDENIARTQKFLFEALWESLPDASVPVKVRDF